MAWTTVSEADILGKLSEDELAIYRSTQADPESTDPLSDIISRVVSEVRARIAANAANTLDDGETVPSSVVDHLLAVVRYRLLTRLPIRVSEDRRTEYEDALDFLSDVAAGKVAIEDPGSGVTAKTSDLQVARYRTSVPSATNLASL